MRDVMELTQSPETFRIGIGESDHVHIRQAQVGFQMGSPGLAKPHDAHMQGVKR